MAVTPPTRTSGSLGTTKSNATPVTSEPTQLSGPQYNVCADKLIEVIDDHNALEAASSGAIIWEWNGVDVSQFDTPSIVIDAGGNPGTLGANITTGTGPNSPHAGGVTLIAQTTGAGVSGERYALFPITQTLPQKYIVEINSDNISSAVDLNRGWGFLTMADFAGSGQGYLWHAGGRRARLDAGLVVAGNATSLVSTTGSGQITMRVEGRAAPFADYAHFQQLLHFAEGQVETSDNARNAFDANDGDWSIGAGLPPASWIGSAGDRFGLAVLPVSSAPDWTINSMRILSL